MDETSIGVRLDDLRLPVREAVTRAAQMELRCLEVRMMEGELDPRQLGATGRRHFLRFVSGLGLRLAALSADMPGVRLTDPARVEERIDRTRDALLSARELHVPIVTALVSALTHPDSGEPSSCAVEALRQIGADAERAGVVFALCPGADRPEGVARLLAAVDRPMVRLCVDPAALIMSGVSPTSVVASRPADIVLSHARDGTAGTAERPGVEARLGEGDVDWTAHLALLEAAGYGGPHILRRRDATDPIAELVAGRRWLERVGLARDAER